MALSFNPFTKKKKEDQIQGSGYTSAYASNPGNTTVSMLLILSHREKDYLVLQVSL